MNESFLNSDSIDLALQLVLSQYLSDNDKEKSKESLLANKRDFSELNHQSGNSNLQQEELLKSLEADIIKLINEINEASPSECLLSDNSNNSKDESNSYKISLKDLNNIFDEYNQIKSDIILNTKKSNPINKIVKMMNSDEANDQKEILVELFKEENGFAPNIINLRSKSKGLFKTKKKISRKDICCTCTKSHCLKLYCDCFKKSIYCTKCLCDSCFNNKEYDLIRQASINHLKNKNKNAFKEKIVLDDDSKHKHVKGCNCKNSNCLKGYCECHQLNVKCSILCKCRECLNME